MRLRELGGVLASALLMPVVGSLRPVPNHEQISRGRPRSQLRSFLTLSLDLRAVREL